MPSNSKRNTITRQWELLKLLPCKGSGKSALRLKEDLCALGFQVTKRQVERDLLELEAVFSLDCNSASIPYGWKWNSNVGNDLPSMTIAESLSLSIVEEFIKPLIPQVMLSGLESRFRHASNKLSSLDANLNPAGSWVNKVKTVMPSLPLLPPIIESDVLEVVHDCLMNDELITATYTGFTDKRVDLILHPLGMIARGPVTYLVATANQYTDKRLYALHRFVAAKRSYVRFVRPKDFNLADYVHDGFLEFGAPQPIKMVAYISETVMKILSETPLSQDQRFVLKDGLITLEASVSNSWQLEWWILSMGENIEILKPKPLRKVLAERIKKAAAQYG